MAEPGSFVDRDDVSVMLQRVPDEVPAIRRAWDEFERTLGSLRGRKFYGSFDPTSNEYAVCVVLRQGDDPDALGLERATLPGGRYVRARLKGEPPDVYDLIPAMMQRLAERPDRDPTRPQRLAERPDRDPTRPQLEFYRQRDEIDLLVPVTLSP